MSEEEVETEYPEDPAEALKTLKDECMVLQGQMRKQFGKTVSPTVFIQVEIDTLVDFLFAQFFENPDAAKTAFQLELYSRMKLISQDLVRKAITAQLTEGIVKNN